jgi:translocation and assembly module TamB
MASERHLLRNTLIGLAAALALLALGAGWLLGSESGARTVLAMASGGPLRFEGVHGRLAGPLQLDRIVVEQPNQRIDVEGVEFDWRPAALLHGVLHASRLHAAKLTLSKKIEQQQEPLKLPDSIDLPLAVQLDDAVLDGGAIAWGPLDVIRIGATAFAFDYDHTRHRIRLKRFSARSDASGRTVGGDLAGDATIATRKPYAVQADFASSAHAAFDERRFASQAHLHAGGSLAELVSDIDVAVAGMRLQGSSILRPFSDRPLGNTALSLNTLDLSAFDSALPHTALAGKLAVAADGSGSIDLRNDAAGPYDNRRLPLAALRARIAQRLGRIDIDDMSATLGSATKPAGSIKGKGSYADGGVTLALALDNIDLRRIDGRIRATQLDGRIELRHAHGRQHVALDVDEPFGKRRIALSAAATLGDALIDIERADVRLGEGRLHASGRVELENRQAFSLSGELRHLRSQELGHLASLPAFDLNGSFEARGARSPSLDADLAFQLKDSTVAGVALRGDGEARLHGEKLSVPKFLVAAGDNVFDARGELSSGNSQIAFALTAPRLDQLGNGFGGAFKATGTARGTPARPRIAWSWSGEHLALPGQVHVAATEGKADIALERGRPAWIERVDADGSLRETKIASWQFAASDFHLQFGAAANAPLALDIHASGLAGPQFAAQTVTASAQGSTDNHRMQLGIVESGNDQRWRADARGGLDLKHGPSWQGRIDHLDAIGRFAARLSGPASLLASRERFALEQFRLEGNTATFVVDSFVRDPHGIATRGRLEHLRVAELLKFADQPPPLTTDLVFDGDWDISFARYLSGSVNIRRTGGDLVMRSGAPVALGLGRLETHAVSKNGMLDLQFNAEGRQLGRIELSASTNTASSDKRFAITADAPLQGLARIDIPSLAWAGPMISATAVTEGRLQSEVAVHGTLAQPEIAGRIAGSALRLYLPDSGVDLRQGRLDGAFANDRLDLRELSFNGNGRLAITGPIHFAGGKPDAQLALQAQRFMLLNRSDRKLVLSGNGKVGWQQGRTSATGAFAIDSGEFDIGREDMPQLSDDVVIVGREQKSAGRANASVDIDVDLGNRVAIHGRGLDAMLAGRLHLTSEPGSPLRAQGTVSIARGTWSAYGRKLAIEQGVLRFSGPIDNPALDILAMRRTQDQGPRLDVEAGVAVRGTVLAPRVTLVSEPAVPDAEKLSWLVLGHGLDSAGTSDLGALQSAAGALLSQGAASTVQSHIATAFGLDDFRIATSQDNLQQRIVTLGKRLSSRLYVSYEQSLKSATSVVLLRYALSERLTVEAEAGTRSALSLLYNMMFD